MSPKLAILSTIGSAKNKTINVPKRQNVIALNAVPIKEKP